MHFNKVLQLYLFFNVIVTFFGVLLPQKFENSNQYNCIKTEFSNNQNFQLAVIILRANHTWKYWHALHELSHGLCILIVKSSLLKKLSERNFHSFICLWRVNSLQQSQLYFFHYDTITIPSDTPPERLEIGLDYRNLIPKTQ